jgi:hypothetical protein
MLYYYPNKPILIHPSSPQVKEKSDDLDWWSEIKKNGTRLCLWKSKEDSSKYKSFNDFVFWNRTKEILSYEPSQEMLDQLNTFKIPECTHIDAELLHNQTKHIKHFIYVYDIYWYKGKQVFETLEVRRKMIEDIFGNGLSHIQLAQTYQNDFVNLFKKVIVEKENEGLVIKNKKSKIVWSLKKCLEVPWQFKIRKPSSSYQY